MNIYYYFTIPTSGHVTIVLEEFKMGRIGGDVESAGESSAKLFLETYRKMFTWII
jgi:hypothetical protein